MEREYFWLSDRQFARLVRHLPTDTRGKPRVDDRWVISGIIHVSKSGCRWVDAPAVYGPRKTLYNRFVRWAAKGVNRPFNRGYLSTPVSYPCQGQGPFRGPSLMIVFEAGASTC